MKSMSATTGNNQTIYDMIVHGYMICESVHSHAQDSPAVGNQAPAGFISAFKPDQVDFILLVLDPTYDAIISQVSVLTVIKMP